MIQKSLSSVVFTGLLTALVTGRGTSSLAEGKVRPPVRDINNCTWSLRCEEAIPENGRKTYLDIYLARQDGKFVSAIGTGRGFNVAAYQVDPSAMTYENGRLEGTLAITFNADPYKPFDPFPGTLKIAVNVDRDKLGQDGALQGTYDGQVRGEHVQGSVRGRIEATDALPFENCSVTLVMNNAWVGGDNHLARRMALGFSLRDGKAEACRYGGVQMTRNSPDADIDIEPGKYSMTLDGPRFEAKAEIPYRNLDVKEGDPSASYTFELKGN